MPEQYQREHPDRAHYRAFPLDASGKIASTPLVIEAGDDEKAMSEARTLAEGRLLEIWIGNRKVGAIQPE